MKQHASKTYGLVFIAILTAIVWWIDNAGIVQNIGLGSLTLAILLGIVLGNSIYPALAHKASAGMVFSKGTLLRAGIVLYGFRVTLQQVNQVGLNAIVTDAMMLISTFFITLYIGYRYLKMDKQTVILTAAGCSICGAAAVMATEPVLKAQAHKVTVAVAIVVIFGTLAMFLYPIMYLALAQYLNDFQYGIYIGSTVHEVAQVVAAGHALETSVADTAVITKMIRVMMLAPFLLILSYACQDKKTPSNGQKISIPWFAVWFLVMIGIHSTGLLHPTLIHALVALDNILLIMAMLALGLSTHIASLKQAGIKPFILGAIVFTWLVIGGLAINAFMAFLFQ